MLDVHHMHTRRCLLQRGLLGAASISGLATFLQQGWAAESAVPAAPAVGFGPLLKDPAGIFDLPSGFAYRILSRSGTVMADGWRLPGMMDGMASFAVGGKTVLVRNHEMPASAKPTGPFQDRPLGDAASYDGMQPGGTTTVVIDPATGAVEREFLSLAGTLRNCAGGPTPWGSWISCEETTDRANAVLGKDHGFAFEVPATLEPRLADPVPLAAMGRFRREAVCVHAASGIVYQTEDDTHGCFYRFIPDQPRQLRSGGRLEALRIRGFVGDTTNWTQRDIPVGQAMPVDWVPVDDRLGSPAAQAAERGAHRFTRGEGLWIHGDRMWFTATDGGAKRKGQIWQLERDVLTLFAEPDDAHLLENGDNLVYAPWDDLIVCEDAAGSDADPGQHLVGITPTGRPYHLGRNRLNDSELAGACFAPDGRTLFVNIQTPGLTFAITGPWKS